MSELRDRNGREEVETIAQSKMHVVLSPRGGLPRPPASRSSACEAINGNQIQVLLIQ